MGDVRALVEQLEREATVTVDGREHFNGYGVMSAPFRSGHILALRRFPAISLGSAYRSVWHRSPDGAWSFYTDVPPMQGCPRFFGSASSHSEETAVEIAWTGPQAFTVRVPAADLTWDVSLKTTPVTGVMSAMTSAMPGALWRSGAVLAAMGPMAGVMLRAGKVSLRGAVPNGQAFEANPYRTWVLDRSSATIGGVDLGPSGAVQEQARLGDFWLPQRGLFVIGHSVFEALDPERHSAVPVRPSG